MGGNLAGVVVGAILAVIVVCLAIFFALRCLRRRRRELIDEETSTISSQSTESTQDESPITPEEGVVNHLAICRRVVPCFASAEYEGPSTREGRFIYGGSLLDNVQQPSAEDLARAGYEPIAQTGERDTAPDRTIPHNDNSQAGNRQAQSTGEESLETSHPAPTFIDRSSFPALPNRPRLQRAGPLPHMAGQPRTQRYRPESYDRTIRQSYDRTIRHRSWTPGHTAQSNSADAQPWHDVGRSGHFSDVNLTLPEIRRLPTLRMPNRIWCDEEQVKER